MKRITFAIIALLAVVAVASPADSQIQNSECRAAQVWHLQQAMHWSTSGQGNWQEWHLGAAQAAGTLAEVAGAPCAGWRDDARPPSYDVGSGEVSSSAD